MTEMSCSSDNIVAAGLRRLDVPLSIHKRRWRSAFFAIYCSRAFLPVFPSCSDNNGFKVDQKTLTQLVKHKSLDRLQELGGVEGVTSALKIDAKLGVCSDAEDVEHRVEAFGSNRYDTAAARKFFHFVWEACQDLTIIILMACAALSLAIGILEHGLHEGWSDGGSIFLAVILVISVSAISNYRQHIEFDKLSKVGSNLQTEAVRNGMRQQISVFEIVVGDVICLKIGDQVPADGLLLDGNSLEVDEASMTGESDHVEINQRQNPFLFSGTKVVDGCGQMLVTSVGMNTAWGEMMSQISSDTSEPTPLQARIHGLASSIGRVGLLVALSNLVLSKIYYFIGKTKDIHGKKEFNGSRTKVRHIIMAMVGMVGTAVTIVVAAIPEGLPVAMTITFCYAMKRMMADKAMVRKLSACEIMGSSTTICTDKTGTLTLNQMKVAKFWIGENPMEEAYSSISSSLLCLIQEGVAMNTTGFASRHMSGSGLELSGSPTEKAILSWASTELHMDMDTLRTNCDIEGVEVFTSQKKRSGVVIKRKVDNTMRVHWKGAAEVILAMCTRYHNASGDISDMDDGAKQELERIIQGMAASSLRCIAIAHREVSPEQVVPENKTLLKDYGLTLLGLLGLKNPCRPGVKKAIEECQNAGVNIKMITGDNIFTAKSIATECGILKLGEDTISEAVIEGEQFRNYTPEERMQKVDNIRVMARSSPSDKLLMVKCLKQKGHVVAVTGDGTNDAPALKEADVGLSMGMQGTEVAKESSDIVIMDDNFDSVAKVLRWGRCVYNNIQKFIQFQLTVNVAALVINFVAAASAGEVPLTAVQLLWVNLIMDTLGALALATDKPTKELMENPPVSRTEPLITNIMWRNLLPQALYQIAVVLTLRFRGNTIFGVDDKVQDTLIFNTFVLCQVFNEFNARKLEKKNIFKGLLTNKIFLGIIALIIVLQLVMVELLNKYAGTERLNWGQWGICLGIAAISWPLGCVVKCLPVPQKPIVSYLDVKKYKNSS
ncbi:putative calcium-transporting ATPase 13, plasma membrane-type [Argentina anserina]|uniref:putative calcium-transporting ATPase 13, plasma membrane-type n=1 Tax=Argentina anserina TaxID=57926 RepID=UPI00217689A1|nr:putative calcium-transporting ATPase 13, plasma membrane-type [Potentilla anserina]